MKRTTSSVLGLVAASALTASAQVAQNSESPRLEASAIYTYRTPTQDGIGKVYMGREISFVMGHRGVDWLERPEREREERADLLVESLNLAPDHVIADIGAGSGYFTFRLSPLVPQGRVLAVDIQPEMLTFLNERALRLGASNVETLLGSERAPHLPAEAVDAALMVDAYHEFSHPREMKSALLQALKPGGRIFLVEYRGEDPDLRILPLHKMTVSQARKEFEAAGFEFVKNLEVLPVQHLMIFRKPEAPAR